MNNPNRLVFTVLFIISFTLCRAENAKLTVNLKNSGFHRNLEYIVVFPDLQGKQNTFIMKQPLPASVYVSTDQLDDLSRFDKISYFTDKEFIDIEKPTEKSKPFQIHLFGNTAFLQTISLPIHFRYHAPGNKSFITVEISYPELYVEVNDNLPISDGSMPIWMLCKDLRQQCKYIQVQYDNYSRKALSANIPIGNANLSGKVTVVTITLSWIAAIYIIFVIQKKYKLLKIKLK